MMSLMMKENKQIGNLVQNFEKLSDDIFVLLAVFDKYEGGDFCTGLIFGKNGATLLTKLA